MHLAELKERIGTFRLTIIVFSAMALMAWFGFQLAGFVDSKHVQDLNQANQTIERLKLENEGLLTEKNQLQVKLTLAQMSEQEARKGQTRAVQEQAELIEQIAFYQRVVAPETTQDGFSVDALNVSSVNNTQYWQLNAVLLQQRKIKAMISGTMTIDVKGTRNGKPDVFTLSDKTMTSGNLKYGFRYFQTIEAVFELPAGFIPSSIDVSTTVYQYRKAKGKYSREFDWQEASAIPTP